MNQTDLQRMVAAIRADEMVPDGADAALRWLGAKGAAASIDDGGTITHGLANTPTWAQACASTAGEIVSVTALDATTITIAIKKHDGTAGTTQTVYWEAA